MTEKPPAYQVVACADCVLKEPSDDDLALWSPYHQDLRDWGTKLAQYVKENVRSDDDELVTPEFFWKELEIGDSAELANVKRFQICLGIRVMFYRDPHGIWANGRLYCGSGQCHIVPDVTKGQVRSLMRSLKIGVK